MTVYARFTHIFLVLVIVQAVSASLGLPTTSIAYAQSPRPETEYQAPQAASGGDHADHREATLALQDGLVFEEQGEWIQAIRHYESATRLFPRDAELRRRLLISRLHYDVVRRSSDSSINNMLVSVSVDEALELYSEVLARLEMSYVDPIDMTDVVRGGTAYLEVALTEPAFVSEHVPQSLHAEIESFRTSIHRLTLAHRITNRFEARRVIAQAAQAGQQALRLSPQTTVLQFVMGAVALLDPYSSFMSSAELNEVESQIEGNFVGLGIALEPHESPLRVLSVIPGGPALEAGVQADDLILEVGAVRCSDVGAERAADLLRGPENSRVRLLVQRSNGTTFECVVPRRRVEVPSIEDATILEQATGIAYLKISSFQKTTLKELDDALWNLHRQGMQTLIIDLRGNPGGWLDASVAVADRFITDGIIVSTRGKNGIENQNYTATASGTWQVPLVLLIDDQSASASEILAGAIGENNRGQLVGETTYGKGSVQGLFHTKALGSGIRLTVSKFFSPTGRAISERGVEPNIEVEDDEAVRFVSKPVAGQANSRITSDRALSVAMEQARRSRLTARQPFSRN